MFSPQDWKQEKDVGLIACIQYSTEIYSHCNRARNVNVKYCKVCVKGGCHTLLVGTSNNATTLDNSLVILLN